MLLKGGMCTILKPTISIGPCFIAIVATNAWMIILMLVYTQRNGIKNNMNSDHNKVKNDNSSIKIKHYVNQRV